MTTDKTPPTPDDPKPEAKADTPPTTPDTPVTPAPPETGIGAGAATATATATAPPVADPVTARLTELGLNADQIGKVKALGAESVEDLSGLQEGDLAGILPTLKARSLVRELQAGAAPATGAAGAMDMGAAAMNMDAVLPSVPDDGSWLTALRAGGVRKMEQSTVISAIRAALADQFGLYDIPKKLVTEMENYVDVTEEQVGDEFWTLRKSLTRKSYGDLFQAIEGLDASYVTDKRKNELLGRINENLWPSIFAFNEALAGWQEAWMQGAANPAMMMAALAGSAGGMGMPPGMMQPPDCGVLRDAAETVNDALNRTFRGTGVQITAALAFEANQVKAMLENPRLPMLCGIPTRELLLKKLKVAVPATYPRMEVNVTRFVLGIMGAERVPAGNDELQYFGTLFMLGTQIPWEDLASTASFQKGSKARRPRGIGSKQNDPFED
jgi:hypothetical protein